jgi:hypothetical protein
MPRTARRDFMPALEQFPGQLGGALGGPVSRMTAQWQVGYGAFGRGGLPGSDYVYVPAGGVHLSIGLDEAGAAVLVLVGVRAGGRKELRAIAGGYRESSARHGLGCCATASGAACAPRSWLPRRHFGLMEGAARGVPGHQGTRVPGS